MAALSSFAADAPPVAPAHPRPDPHLRTALVTLAALALLAAWDGSGLDMAVARWSGSASGFALKDDWVLFHLFHEVPRRLSWLLVLGLSLSIWWPVGVLRRLTRLDRLQLALGTLLGLAVVSLTKYASHTSCPWELAEFGGLARHVSHWAWGVSDGGGGRCFPAGHASAGFAFLSGFFALRRRAPRAAQAWLAAALAAGFTLGLAQQLRGAHFMSHTLWTAWLCWTSAWLCDLGFGLLRRRPALFRQVP